MGIIAAPPREKNPYGSGIEKLIELYLMKSIGALFELPEKEAQTNLDLVKEFGGEFTPEQAGALERSINPKTGIMGIIDKFRKPASTGFTSIPGAKPSVDTLPIELGANAEPGQIEIAVDPDAQTQRLIPNIPTVGGRQSILQSILQPTERGTYRMPSREERLTRAFKERARFETGEHGEREKLSEEAKGPWREKEEESKSARLAATLQEREKYHDAMYKGMLGNMETRLKIAEMNNESREYIAGLKNQLEELKLTIGKAEASWKEEVARGKLEAYKTQVEKIGQASEAKNIELFQNDMIAKGYMTSDPKTKKSSWKKLTEKDIDDVKSTAAKYGFDASFNKEEDKWYKPQILFPSGYTPDINYKTERSEKKIGKEGAVSEPAGKPKVPKITSQADVDAAIKAANKAIAEGKDPAIVKQRLKDLGIDIKEVR